MNKQQTSVNKERKKERKKKGNEKKFRKTRGRIFAFN